MFELFDKEALKRDGAAEWDLFKGEIEQKLNLFIAEQEKKWAIFKEDQEKKWDMFKEEQEKKWEVWVKEKSSSEACVEIKLNNTQESHFEVLKILAEVTTNSADSQKNCVELYEKMTEELDKSSKYLTEVKEYNRNWLKGVFFEIEKCCDDIVKVFQNHLDKPDLDPRLREAMNVFMMLHNIMTENIPTE